MTKKACKMGKCKDNQTSPRHRYYVVSCMRVPKGYATNDRKKAELLLEKARKEYPECKDPYIIDNEDFYPRERWYWKE